METEEHIMSDAVIEKKSIKFVTGESRKCSGKLVKFLNNAKDLPTISFPWISIDGFVLDKSLGPAVLTYLGFLSCHEHVQDNGSWGGSFQVRYILFFVTRILHMSKLS